MSVCVVPAAARPPRLPPPAEVGGNCDLPVIYISQGAAVKRAAVRWMDSCQARWED